MTATLTPRTTTRFDQVDLDESGPNGATAPGHTEALDPKPTPAPVGSPWSSPRPSAPPWTSFAN